MAFGIDPEPVFSEITSTERLRSSLERGSCVPPVTRCVLQESDRIWTSMSQNAVSQRSNCKSCQVFPCLPKFVLGSTSEITRYPHDAIDLRPSRSHPT